MMVRRLARCAIDFWFAPVAPARFVLWQRVFSTTFLIFVAGWSMHAREWLTDYGYHVSANATNPVYPAPFPLVPQAWLVPFLVLLFASTLGLIADAGGRAIKLVVLGLAVYIQLVDQTSSFTLNKLYIFGFFLIAFASPSRPVVVVDGSLQPRMSAWPVRVMQATLLIQYTTAGTCKAFLGDWLKRPDVLFTHAVGVYRTEIAGLAMQYLPAAFWTAAMIFALVFELFAAPLFMIPKLRRFGIAAGCLMHIGIALLMKDLIFFSLQMMSFYVLFLSDAFCARVEEKLARGVSACLGALSRSRAPASPR